MRKIKIEESVFKEFSDFKRGIIIVKDIENSADNSKIKKLLTEEIEKKVNKNYLEHPLVREWEEVHRKFGSNPNRFPPSIKSLLKRVQKGKPLPFINSIVAIFNLISLKYLIPCGGDDVDTIKGDLVLGFSKGKENFSPLGQDKRESPDEGEVIYYDNKSLNVMCRKWNWRNSRFTLITENSKKIIINLDGMKEASREYIIKARDEMGELITNFCKGKIEKDYLDINKKETTTPF